MKKTISASFASEPLEVALVRISDHVCARPQGGQSVGAPRGSRRRQSGEVRPEGTTLGEATVDLSGSTGAGGRAGTGEVRASPGGSAALPEEVPSPRPPTSGAWPAQLDGRPPAPSPGAPVCPARPGCPCLRAPPLRPAAGNRRSRRPGSRQCGALLRQGPGARSAGDFAGPGTRGEGSLPQDGRGTRGGQGARRGPGAGETLPGVVTSAVRVCPVSWSSSRSPEQLAALPRPS